MKIAPPTTVAGLCLVDVRPDRAATRSVTAGTSTRPTSRSPDAGRYVYRAIDQNGQNGQNGQIIDVYVSPLRDTRAARRFFAVALSAHAEPAEVVTDRAWTLRAAIAELIPGAFHDAAQYANNRIEADHGRLESRLRPMRGLKRDRSARVVIRGHAFVQNVRRGHYELGVEARRYRRIEAVFTELARTI